MDDKMYKKILKLIKKYETIVIARHIGVDPDAMSSEVALREIIKLNFPNKKVYAIGNGSIKFSYLGTLNKINEINTDAETLLIVLDTPDKRRVDLLDFTHYKESIKIDHHPFIEEFCTIEKIDDQKSSTSEMILDFVNDTEIKMNKEIAEIIFMGIVSDTNRFLFNNATSETFLSISNLLKKYKLDITKLYAKLYERPLNEVRLQGYMEQSMELTSNGVGFMKVDNETINKFHVDSASVGNLINNFNFIEGVLVWVTLSEDIKLNQIRVSIRSRGPIINKIAENYNGGGHKLASGARLTTFDESKSLIKDLDEVCLKYIKKEGNIDENN